MNASQTSPRQTIHVTRYRKGRLMRFLDFRNGVGQRSFCLAEQSRP